MESRFEREKNFNFTHQDQEAEILFSKIQNDTRKQLPQSIYSSNSSFKTDLIMTHIDKIKQTSLYQLMKNVPKGVLHHCHIDCCEDKDFYRKYIVNDPIIYVTSDKKQFRIGTSEQASKNNWISMKNLRKEFQTQDEMVDFISNITMMNDNDYLEVSKGLNFWEPFQKKISNFFSIFYSLKHFKLYMKHVFQKYLKNQYDRLEWRALLVKLFEYDEEGRLVHTHEEKKFTEAIDEVYNELKKEYPNFTLGVVFFGLLEWTQQENAQIFRKVCEINWDKTIGLDVVQEQKYSLKPYIETIDKVLAQFPHLNYKKVLHAGDSLSSLNNNVELAIQAGSVRIGHGTNIVQRLEFINECRKVCFECCPVSGCVTGTRHDIRIVQAPMLMSLGVPISINPDDPGKFGYEDSTLDFFISMLAFNWSLKDLKLVGIYSIKYAVCEENEKIKLSKNFLAKWDKWVSNLLQEKV